VHFFRKAALAEKWKKQSRGGEETQVEFKNCFPEEQGPWFIKEKRLLTEDGFI